MKLVMTLYVRDEEDIIAANLDYHFSQGVDLAIVTDNGSVDGTVEILEGYERAGKVRLFHYPVHDHEQAKVVTGMARLAFEDHGADWVINNDADEFWWPRQGNLKTTLAAMDDSVGVVVARRTNFPPLPVQERPFYESMIYREVQSLNPAGVPLPPKVCHRAAADIEVGQGNHRVSSPSIGRAIDDGSVEVFHFPARSYPQFQRKVINTGSSYEANGRLPWNVGRAQRELYRVYKEGGLPGYYAGLVLEKRTLAARLERGELVVDTRLRDFFRAMNR